MLLAALAFVLGQIAQAQFGRAPEMSGPPRGPELGGHLAKVFNDHPNFAADVEFEHKDASGRAISMPGKLAYTEGKSRFETDMASIKGGGLPPDAATQMKEMGMDKMVIISRPDRKTAYTVYPGMNAYLERKTEAKENKGAEPEAKVEITELGKEKVGGRECIKNKVIVTDKDGTKHESIVWNATDLKKFPVKIETKAEGGTMTMVFKEVKMTKPAEDQFDLPAGASKHDSMMGMMQQKMMEKMGGMKMEMPAR